MSNKIEQISNDKFFTFVVDPNPPNKDYFPPEDLFVWVNFRALPKSRSIIETDGTYSSDFFDSKGVQFISTTEQNGKGYITTSYTDIGGGNPSEKEAFGIRDITMEYGASLVPEVKINFVDVRGAGLFNGYELEDEKGLKYNSSEFSSFFRLPYPVFELSVKGFFGKAVTYCLHLRKWSASFDAASGNFIIEADFIGYTFAFLTDILMKYVSSVTSSNIGASALKKAGVISIDELMVNLGRLTQIAEEFKDNSADYTELKVVNSILYALDNLSKTIGNPVTVEKNSEFGEVLPYTQLRKGVDQLFVRDIGLISEQSKDLHDTIVEDINDFVKAYNQEIEDNISKYSYLNQFKITDADVNTPALTREINTTTVEYIKSLVINDGINSNLSTVSEDSLRTRLGLSTNDTKKFFVINYYKFRQQISDLKSEVGDKKNELERIVNEKLNTILGQKLGFNLTIGNIFQIILGNVEAFLEVVYDIAVEAENPNLQTQRVGELNNVRTDINPDDDKIYPFPAAFDSNTGEEIWIGDLVGENNAAFPEIRLIKEVMNSLTSANSAQVQERIRQNNSGNITKNGSDWIPVNPIDYANNELSNIDGSSFAANIVPVNLADAIVSRALASYDHTLYNQNRNTFIARIEGAYAVSQILNDQYKQAINNFDSTDFVNQVITASSFLNNRSKNNTLNNYTFDVDKGLLLGSIDDKYINLINGTKRKVLPTEVSTVISDFGKTLKKILIPTNQEKYHRDIEAKNLFVVGDLTDSMWNKNVFANIRRYVKGKTNGSDLEAGKTYSFNILSKINDLTIVDGQLNSQIDFVKETDKEKKFTNNAKKYIAQDLIAFDNSIFDTEYYIASDNIFKSYLFLITIPLENIGDIYDIFQLGGVYKITKIQLAWIGAQFWRALEIKNKGIDPFDTLLKSQDLKNSLGVSFKSFKDLIEELRDNTKKYLPDLSLFYDNSIELDNIVNYFFNWVDNDFINPTLDILNGENIEFFARKYRELSNINTQSQDYLSYKENYNELLERFFEIVDFIVISPRKILKNVSSEMDEAKLRDFVNSWHQTFKKIVRDENKSGISTNNTPNPTPTEEQQFYIQDKDLKIATYSHFKNLYDKWIGGNKNGQLHNFCSGNSGKPRISKLFDRFHFIDRTWSHIGDRAVINPKPLMILSEKSDINLYTLIDVILNDSNFDFHVLPSWVNYKSLNDVYDMWKPHTDVENISSGASYIAMYMAGSSKVLDIGKKAFYVNDGFDLRDIDKENIPDGFKNRRVPTNIDELEDNEKFKYNMVVFRVGYADQNQNIFKDITNLSQQEHRESAESLQALHDNFDGQGGTKRFYKGVNLYNIFALRSYQCTITCMGNMQIHPMTYFQLDNIPFFHGAYLITKVKHSIKPHYVETEFTGTRVPRFVYPIVEDATSYVNIPLSDTLFKNDTLKKPIVRPLNGDDDGYHSFGSDEGIPETNPNIPTAVEFAALEAANNVVFVAQNSEQNYTFYIENSTVEEFNTRFNNRFSGNPPVGYTDTSVGLCARWVRYALRDIGIVGVPNGFDAWDLFAAMNDNELIYVDTNSYKDNVSSQGHGLWSNNDLKTLGIPDGSLVFSTYITSASKQKSIDAINKKSPQKIPALKKLLTVDPQEQALGNQFLAVTHIAIFANGQLHHQCRTVLSQPNSTKIIAYYPFKQKAIKTLNNPQ